MHRRPHTGTALRSCNLQLLDSNARHAETAPHLSARLRQQAWIYTRPTAGAPPRIEPLGCVPPRPAASRFNSSSSGVRLKRFASFLSSRHRWELGRDVNWTASNLRAVTSSLRRSARSSSAGAPVTAAAATRTLEACEASGMRAGPQMRGLPFVAKTADSPVDSIRPTCRCTRVAAEDPGSRNHRGIGSGFRLRWHSILGRCFWHSGSRSNQIDEGMIREVEPEQRPLSLVAVVGRLARLLRFRRIVSVRCESSRTDFALSCRRERHGGPARLLPAR